MEVVEGDLIAKRLERDGGGYWFVRGAVEDRWLILFGDSGQQLEEVKQEIRDELSRENIAYRMHRLCAFIGEPMETIEHDTIGFAEMQREMMWKMPQDIYLKLMERTVEEVVRWRSAEEIEIMSEEAGQQPPSMN